MVKPSIWEVEHASGIFAGQAYQASHDGGLPDTPIWRMLERRYDLNEVRFGFYHPNLRLIIEIEHARNHVPTEPTCWTEHPVDPPYLNPQTIPEPASLVMGSICVAAWLAAAFVLGRRDSRK